MPATTLIFRQGPQRPRMARFRDSCGALDEQPGLLVDVSPTRNVVVGVAVHAADKGGDVDVEDVPVLDQGSVRDAVADDFVQ